MKKILLLSISFAFSFSIQSQERLDQPVFESSNKDGAVVGIIHRRTQSSITEMRVTEVIREEVMQGVVRAHQGVAITTLERFVRFLRRFFVDCFHSENGNSDYTYDRPDQSALGNFGYWGLSDYSRRG